MPGRYHPDPLSLSHGRTMGRRICEWLSHSGDSDSKRYHQFRKKSTHCIRKIIKKAEKMEAGEDGFVGFQGNRLDQMIRNYFVLTGWASFTTSRTGYSESESGTLYMVPVRIAGTSVRAMSAG